MIEQISNGMENAHNVTLKKREREKHKIGQRPAGQLKNLCTGPGLGCGKHPQKNKG